MAKQNGEKLTDKGFVAGGTAYTLAAVFSITLSFLYSIIITVASKLSGVSVNEITAKNGVIGRIKVACLSHFVKAKLPAGAGVMLCQVLLLGPQRCLPCCLQYGWPLSRGRNIARKQAAQGHGKA